MTAHPISKPSNYRPLSIALVIVRYFDFGGLQNEMLRIAKVLIERGHTVEVITSAWEGNGIDGVDRYIVPITAKINHKKIQQLASIVENRVKEKHFDCVVGFNKIPGLDFYFAGDVCLAEKIDKEKAPFVKLLPRYRFYLNFEKAVFGEDSNTDILLLAHGAVSMYQHYYHIQASRLHLIPPGVAKDRFEINFDRQQAKQNLRDEWSLPQQARVIIHVGSAFYRKGVDRIIEALDSLPQQEKNNTWLFVIGNDNPKKMVKLAQKLGIKERVIFTGPRNDVDAFYQGADFLVHPAREECAGMIIVESLYCGLPVITTENVGFAWHVKQASAGRVIDYPFSQKQLNDTVAELLALNSNQYKTLSENAKHYCLTEEVHNLPEAVADIIETKVFSSTKT
ncbi:MAG: glycosyltransferase family 4 protein [Methylophagaceae bacterium]